MFYLKVRGLSFDNVTLSSSLTSLIIYFVTKSTQAKLSCNNNGFITVLEFYCHEPNIWTRILLILGLLSLCRQYSDRHVEEFFVTFVQRYMFKRALINDCGDCCVVKLSYILGVCTVFYPIQNSALRLSVTVKECVT